MSLLAFLAAVTAAQNAKPKKNPCVWCGGTGEELHPCYPGRTRPCSVCQKPSGEVSR